MTPVSASAEPGATPPSASPAPQRPAVHRPWIPIRSLSPAQRPRILAHLLDLDARDRYLRFGYQASDEQIGRYVGGLNFERDEVFGVFNRRLRLIALAHLAFPEPGQNRPVAAEFGGSVAADVRGRGYGARLFEQATLHTRNRGVDQMFIHALSENTAMLRIARQAGAQVVRDGAESEAYLKLPTDTVASHMEQWVEERAGAVDYQIKQGARKVDSFIDVIGEVRTGLQQLAGRAPRD